MIYSANPALPQLTLAYQRDRRLLMGLGLPSAVKRVAPWLLIWARQVAHLEGEERVRQSAVTYNGSFVADTIITTLEPEALEAISPHFPSTKGSISSALSEQEVVQHTPRLKEWCLGKTTVREQMCAVFFFDDMNVCEKAESTKKTFAPKGVQAASREHEDCDRYCGQLQVVPCRVQLPSRERAR